jgi:protein ImuB
MLWLGMHFPALPLDVFTLREGLSDDRVPRVVVDGRRIVLRDAAAEAAAIVTGSTLATAQSIAPQVRHYRRDRRAEFRRLRYLGEVMYRFSSHISAIDPDGLVVEIGASLRLFGGIDALSAEIARTSTSLGHSTCTRIAPTPLAALALARSGADHLEHVPLVYAALESNVLMAAEIEQLGNMGIHTLGQLFQLPKAGLGERFGPALVSYLDRLQGASPDPRAALTPPDRFQRAVHLLSPIHGKPALFALPITQLITELHHWLMARQLGIHALRFRFSSGARSDPPVHLAVRFAAAEHRAEHFGAMTRLALERAVLPAEVISVELKVEQLVPQASGAQTLAGLLPPHLAYSNTLFQSAPQPATKRGTRRKAARTEASHDVVHLSEFIDRLEARLGTGTCQSLVALQQPLPEAAWAAASPEYRQLKPNQNTSPAQADQHAAAQPTWLFDAPQPIVIDHFALQQGPMRVESGWWMTATGEPCWRDYYVARLPSGALGWVYTDASAAWFLQGYFG